MNLTDLRPNSERSLSGNQDFELTLVSSWLQSVGFGVVALAGGSVNTGLTTTSRRDIIEKQNFPMLSGLIY